jgi:hypothetical protein
VPSRHDRTAHTGGTHALTRAPPALPACWRRSPWQRNARRADKGTMLAAFSAGPRGRALPRGCSGRPVARVLRTGTRQMRVVSSRACVGGGASPSAPNLVRPHRSQVEWRSNQLGERSYRRARCRSAAAQRVQTPWRLGHAQIRHRTRRSRCCHTMPNLMTIRLPCASRSRPAKHVRTYQDEFVHRSNAHTSQMIGAGTHARPHPSWSNRTPPVALAALSVCMEMDANTTCSQKATPKLLLEYTF